MTTEPQTEPSLVAPSVGEANIQPPAGTATDDRGAETVPAGEDTSTSTDTQPGTDSVAGNDSIAPLTADSYADLTVPEGMTVDDALMSEAKTLFAEAGVKPSEAGKLLGLYQKASLAAAAQSQAQFKNLNDTWRAETLALPEFTGTRKDSALSTINKVIDEFGTPEVRDVFDATGAGNNPQFLKMMLKIGEALSEGRPTPTGQPRTSGRRSYAEIQYGNKPQ